MKKVIAIIEKADDGGYGVYIPSIPGMTALGRTEAEAKENLRAAIADTVAYCRENGIEDKELNGGKLEFDFRYDMSGFFRSFDVFNVSALGRYLGINSGLMRRYKVGKAYISEQQKKKIESGIHRIAGELQMVKF